MTLHHDGQAFTDSCLASFKDLLLKGHLYSDLVLDKDLLALIARLEAAEAYIKFDHRNWVEGGPKQEALYEAWRKAAGK